MSGVSHAGVASFRGGSNATDTQPRNKVRNPPLAGRLGEAGLALDRTLEAATELGDLTTQDVAHGYYASLERHRGYPPAALAHSRQAVDLAEQVGSPTGLRQALYHFGRAHLASGDLEQARSVLERGLATGGPRRGSRVRPFQLRSGETPSVVLVGRKGAADHVG